jgi:hypothetical protein
LPRHLLKLLASKTTNSHKHPEPKHRENGCLSYLVVGLDLDLVSWRQKRVEAHDELWVAFEQVRHALDHPRCVDAAEKGKSGGEKL